MKNKLQFSAFSSFLLLSLLACLLFFLPSCGAKSQKTSLAKKWEFDTTAYKKYCREVYDKKTKAMAEIRKPATKKP